MLFNMDSGLIISLSGIISGVIFLMLKLCFKSKCSEVNICYGLFQIKRDVQVEANIENEELKQHTDSSGLNNVV